MKIFKSIPILMTLATACGTDGNFEGGNQLRGSAPTRTAKTAAQSSNAIGGEATAGDESDATPALQAQNAEKSPEVEEKAGAPTPQGLAFADQVDASVKAQMASLTKANPNALSAQESAQLTAALGVLGKNAALGKGAAATAANVKAVLDLVAKLANVKLPALPAAAPGAAANAAALADVAKAVQALGAAAAAADLAKVQAALADLVKAIMALVA